AQRRRRRRPAHGGGGWRGWHREPVRAPRVDAPAPPRSCPETGGARPVRAPARATSATFVTPSVTPALWTTSLSGQPPGGSQSSLCRTGKPLWKIHEQKLTGQPGTDRWFAIDVSSFA